MSKNRCWNDGNTKPLKSGIYERHIAGVIRENKWYKGKWLDGIPESPAIYQKLPWRKKI